MDSKMVETCKAWLKKRFPYHHWMKCSPVEYGEEGFTAGYQAAIAALTPQFGDVVPTEPGWVGYFKDDTGTYQVGVEDYMHGKDDPADFLVNFTQPHPKWKLRVWLRLLKGQWAKATPPESKGEGK